jgi:hypothetical protein
MCDTEFEPGKSGWEVPAPRHCVGTPEKRERRLTSPQGALKANIGNTFDEKYSTGKASQWQAYPICLLKERHGLSCDCAAFVAVEFPLGGA